RRPSIVVQSSACAPRRSDLRKRRANASRRRSPMPPMCSAPNSAGNLRTGWHWEGRGGRAGIAVDGYRLIDNRRQTLIEDDSCLADMLGEYLGKAGFPVIHA